MGGGLFQGFILGLIWLKCLSLYPSIDGNGNVIAVWEQSDATRISIWASIYRKRPVAGHERCRAFAVFSIAPQLNRKDATCARTSLTHTLH